jgi:hypothetical protein
MHTHKTIILKIGACFSGKIIEEHKCCFRQRLEFYENFLKQFLAFIVKNFYNLKSAKNITVNTAQLHHKTSVLLLLLLSIPVLCLSIKTVNSLLFSIFHYILFPVDSERKTFPFVLITIG